MSAILPPEMRRTWSFANALPEESSTEIVNSAAEFRCFSERVRKQNTPKKKRQQRKQQTLRTHSFIGN
ncbi:MAG: hypothetical protein LBH00_11495 [Planctomycetaceae bacterium]|nr:hypothetical protein [Planctomycetaceae bacterium]